MVTLIDLSVDKPYKAFKEIYEKALQNNQSKIEACAISTFNKDLDEVESRFVNLKYILKDEWIFFSNYNSPKSKAIKSHNQISALFFWDSINTQVRIKANASISSSKFSDKYFASRSVEKNALAISSSQSERIESFSIVKEKFKKTLKNQEILKDRPDYWGGFSFKPYYFEIWTGGKYRLNNRQVFSKNKDYWEDFYVQP